MANWAEYPICGEGRATAVADAAAQATCRTAIVCRCLGVTASELQDAIEECDARSVQDLRDRTGAGNGCTSCHRLLKSLLASQQ